MRAHARARTHARHTHSLTHKHTHTHTHTRTNTQTHAPTHTHTHKHTHARTHALTHARMAQFHLRFPKRSEPGMNVEPIPVLPLSLREEAASPDNHSDAASGGISTQEHVNPLKQWSKRVVKIPSPNLHIRTHTRKHTCIHACTNFGMRDKLQKIVCALRAT
jgi:hypothetical protein